MARRKKPDNETPEDANIRHLKETVSGVATRNEKVSFNRKMDNLTALLEKIRPIEDQINDLTALKIPLLDQLSELRAEMVKDCVHPYDQITYHQNHLFCKFCNKKFVVKQNT